MYFSKCPRCNEKSYERLKTHSYCVCCNYSPDLDCYKKATAEDLPIPPWAARAVESIKAPKKSDDSQIEPTGDCGTTPDKKAA